jgi:hypothetical protein
LEKEENAMVNTEALGEYDLKSQYWSIPVM